MVISMLHIYYIYYTYVGYGDLYATSGWGRVMSVIMMYWGIVVLALPISILGSVFTREYEKVHVDMTEKEEDENWWDEDEDMPQDEKLQNQKSESPLLEKDTEEDHRSPADLAEIKDQLCLDKEELLGAIANNTEVLLAVRRLTSEIQTLGDRISNLEKRG